MRASHWAPEGAVSDDAFFEPPEATVTAGEETSIPPEDKLRKRAEDQDKFGGGILLLL
jgi:hypothetical protein